MTPGFPPLEDSVCKLQGPNNCHTTGCFIQSAARDGVVVGTEQQNTEEIARGGWIYVILHVFFACSESGTGRQ